MEVSSTVNIANELERRVKQLSDIAKDVSAAAAAAGKDASSERFKKADDNVETQPAYDSKFREVLDDLASFIITSTRIAVRSDDKEIVAVTPSPAKHESSEAGTALYKIVEVEMYAFAAGVYADRFTHCDPQQSRPGTWYFHKKGGTFKNGSFKGLDITFGLLDGDGNVSGGALIRSISLQRKDGMDCIGSSMHEGPSLVVDALLSAAGCASIVELVGSKDGVLSVDPRFGSCRRLQLIAPCGLTPMSTTSAAEPWNRMGTVRVAPRVGLIPRSESDLAYAGRLLRFYASEVKLAKQRAGVIAALLVLGASAAEAQKLSGGTAKNVQNVKEVIVAITGSKKTKPLSAVAKEHTSGGVLGGDVMQGENIAAIVAWAAESNCM